MELENYRKEIKEFKSEDLKAKYINTFVDTNKQYYRDRIQNKTKFKDGYFTTGYLRDTLDLKNGYELISLRKVFDYGNVIDRVYVFWDFHSSYHQLCRDRYWNFNRDAILHLKYDTLLKILDYLPEDIYIFDEDMKWTIIPTHGDIDGKPIIIKLGNVT